MMTFDSGTTGYVSDQLSDLKNNGDWSFRNGWENVKTGADYAWTGAKYAYAGIGYLFSVAVTVKDNVASWKVCQFLTAK